MALTGKKKVFADAVLAGKPNKQAAIAAGYSAPTASAAGSRLVKDKEIAAYLAKHRATPEKGESAAENRPTFDMTKALQHSDPKNFLMAAMNDVALGEKLRIEAAKALMPFVHARVDVAGKKEQKQDAAKEAGGGKFAASAPPRLIVSNK